MGYRWYRKAKSSLVTLNRIYTHYPIPLFPCSLWLESCRFGQQRLKILLRKDVILFRPSPQEFVASINSQDSTNYIVFPSSIDSMGKKFAQLTYIESSSLTVCQMGFFAAFYFCEVIMIKGLINVTFFHCDAMSPCWTIFTTRILEKSVTSLDLMQACNGCTINHFNPGSTRGLMLQFLRLTLQYDHQIKVA